jgi:hypothetical protein
MRSPGTNFPLGGGAGSWKPRAQAFNKIGFVLVIEIQQKAEMTAFSHGDLRTKLLRVSMNLVSFRKVYN